MYRIKTILPDLRGKSRILTLPKLNIQCRFRAEKFKADGTITYQGPEFSNTVLDVGLDLFADNALYSFIVFCNVGTGTSEPAQTDTGLDNRIASSSSTYGSITHLTTNTDPLHYGKIQTIVFAIGSCTGNLTELGLSKSNNSEYFNRQLFRDEFGDPAVITVLSDEGLRVTFDVRIYSEMGREVLYPGNFDLGGVSQSFNQQVNHECFNRYSGSTYHADIHRRLRGNNVLGCIDAETTAFIQKPSTSVAGTENTSRTVHSYASGTFIRDTTLTWAPGTYVGDINRIMVGYSGSGAPDGALSTFILDSPITLADTEEFTLTVRRSWGRT